MQLCTPGSMALVFAVAATAASASPANGGGPTDFLVPSIRCADGTIWAQAFFPMRISAGSAQLGAVDTGEPPMGVGLQAAWLEWNTASVHLGLLGGGLSSAEVLPGGAPLAGNLGAATLNGGFILTFDGGTVTDARACLGSFLWTETNLHLLAVGGGIATAEVTDPGGNPIPDVLGVAVIDSEIFDLSTTFGTVVAHIIGAAIVYTPSHVYHVDVDLSGGISFATTELTQPGGSLPIASTRGVAGVIRGFEFPGLPPAVPIVHGASFLWTDAHVYLVRREPALSIAEALAPGGAALPGVWGVMSIANAGIQPLRGAALLLQPNQAFVGTILPALVLSPATLPPGGPGDPPFATDVQVLDGPALRRQAGGLYESQGVIAPPGAGLFRATIVGHDQRSSVGGT